MRAREQKAYHCEECDFLLLYEWRDTEFGRRLLLIHPPNSHCKLSGKAFYIPRVEVSEFTNLTLRSEQ